MDFYYPYREASQFLWKTPKLETDFEILDDALAFTYKRGETLTLRQPSSLQG